ncbi:hypothetical protein PHLCEN_2v12430 [Hermanssonia centrifuga]|uniref:Uncharacterized protein n=1 Tax=Hermanssonia centrifuga TaxID=98765 RepID=A0A2R6NH30_9APHY|nr:hypothetical protein PHLCEN_2v12430 [Hermanssonia centrifuga]
MKVNHRRELERIHMTISSFSSVFNFVTSPSFNQLTWFNRNSLFTYGRGIQLAEVTQAKVAQPNGGLLA